MWADRGQEVFCLFVCCYAPSGQRPCAPPLSAASSDSVGTAAAEGRGQTQEADAGQKPPESRSGSRSIARAQVALALARIELEGGIAASQRRTLSPRAAVTRARPTPKRLPLSPLSCDPPGHARRVRDDGLLAAGCCLAGAALCPAVLSPRAPCASSGAGDGAALPHRRRHQVVVAAMGVDARLDSTLGQCVSLLP